MKVCAGTKNPSKLEGIKQAFREAFKVEDVELVSIGSVGLTPQPIGLNEILEGALKRVNASSSYRNYCDFYVGVEAGIIEVVPGTYVDVQVAVVRDLKGRQGIGFSPGFQVPDKLMQLILGGKVKELEDAVAKAYNIVDIGEREGVIYLLSRGLLNRTYLTKLSVLMALLKWINEEAYLQNTEQQ
ncbi:MAG: inosine/xanthosine triphosphatase [Thermoprotei archaeon]